MFGNQRQFVMACLSKQCTASQVQPEKEREADHGHRVGIWIKQQGSTPCFFYSSGTWTAGSQGAVAVTTAPRMFGWVEVDADEQEFLKTDEPSPTICRRSWEQLRGR